MRLKHAVRARPPVHHGAMDHQERAYIGLGANVGDAWTALTRAVAALRALPATTLAAVSSLYRTRPVGPVNQPDFLNAVVALDVPAGVTPELGAMALLTALKQLEGSIGRQDRERWGPREIDLDVLLFGQHELHLERAPDARSDDPARAGSQWLDIPHVSAAERLFVLAPLAELSPRSRPPGWPDTVAQTCADVASTEAADAVRLVAAWDADRQGWFAVADAGQRS